MTPKTAKRPKTTRARPRAKGFLRPPPTARRRPWLPAKTARAVAVAVAVAVAELGKRRTARRPWLRSQRSPCPCRPASTAHPPNASTAARVTRAQTPRAVGIATSAPGKTVILGRAAVKTAAAIDAGAAPALVAAR